MNNITQNKERSRCITCKRSKRNAISEQLSLGKSCDVNACGFYIEIEEGIKEKFAIKFTKKEVQKIEFNKKNAPQIKITKKK